MRTVTALATLGWAAFSAVACSSPESTPGLGGFTSGSGSSGAATTGSGGTSSPSSGGALGSGGTATGGVATGGSTPQGAGGAASGAIASGGSPAGAAGSSGAISQSGGSGGAAPTSGGGGSAKGGAANAGASGSGGSAGKGGAIGSAGASGNAGSSGTGGAGGGAGTGAKFSFFVTSVGALKSLSGNEKGFGGDLRFNEATGIAGADKICATIAEKSMPGAGQKTWRAFLSTTTENAGDRIGSGPWYDRMGRLVAASKSDLLQTRPVGADPAIINDLPNESGLPNHLDGAPGCSGTTCPDNHDTLTGTKADGTWDGGSTCSDWSSTTATGAPRVGHSWPASSGKGWAFAHTAGGCGAGINLVQSGGAAKGDTTVGAGGGYGGFYCFALTP